MHFHLGALSIIEDASTKSCGSPVRGWPVFSLASTAMFVGPFWQGRRSTGCFSAWGDAWGCSVSRTELCTSPYWTSQGYCQSGLEIQQDPSGLKVAVCHASDFPCVTQCPPQVAVCDVIQASKEHAATRQLPILSLEPLTSHWLPHGPRTTSHDSLNQAVQPVSDPPDHPFLQAVIPQLLNANATWDIRSLARVWLDHLHHLLIICSRPQSVVLAEPSLPDYFVTYLGMDSKRMCFLSSSETEARLTI